MTADGVPAPERGGGALLRRNLAPVLVLSALAMLPTLVLVGLHLGGLLPRDLLIDHEKVATGLTYLGWLLATGLVTPGAGAALRAPTPARAWFGLARAALPRALIAAAAIAATATALGAVHGLLGAAALLLLAMVTPVAVAEGRSPHATLRAGVRMALSHLGPLLYLAFVFLLLSGAVAAAFIFGGRALMRAVDPDLCEIVRYVSLVLGTCALVVVQGLLACLLADAYHWWRSPPRGDAAGVFA